MSEFDDIRPYKDDEVRPILNRLLNDREFLDSIARLKFSRVGSWLAPVIRPVIRRRLSREVSYIHSVYDFQVKIEGYLTQLLNRTVSNFTYSGLKSLSADQAYLFISNHRDIAMDSAFVNWLLFQKKYGTLRIAIGDNLLTKRFASDLMRLNKSFIVNRSATAPREKLKAAKKLSKYIHQSVLQDRENVWIAQREGRAKDGLDKTNPAIISMLCLSKEKTASLGDYIAEAQIVPISISYEYDPCDEWKARELYQKDTLGSYEKEEHEDVKSIARGISGYKGAVHLHFGTPLSSSFESVEQVTEHLDREIIGGYVLHPSNCIAYEMLNKKSPQVPVGESGKMFSDYNWESERESFSKRIAHCNKKHLDYLLRAYANPVINKMEQP